jgi:bifunctional ADP-heptose synthase (sugar kinase/adenylyltransferase)|tara:strand:- start:3410 stop:4141 length:732 start_codon:yes stop_codon:yes gene_type:complete
MKKVLVVGDSSRDIFVYCNALKLCPDFPVPALEVINQTENAGMAKNVHRNIKGILDSCDLLTNSNWHQITKTRYVHAESNHMFFRVDTPHKLDRIDVSIINYSDYDLIVVSDYDKGFLTEDDINEICNNHPKVFIDTKKILGSWADNAAYIKINNFEYQNSLPYLTAHLKEKIIHTMGAEGCVYQENRYPVKKVEVKDVSGAGDTFMAGLVVEYCKTDDIIKSIKFANKCASEVVTHRGVSVL